MVYALICACVIAVLSGCVNLFLFTAIRGMTRLHQVKLDSYTVQNLTGVEIEQIRRLAMEFGVEAVSLSSVLNLIYTFRSIQLGTYKDLDPYAWQDGDPYDGLGEDRINVSR